MWGQTGTVIIKPQAKPEGPGPLPPPPHNWKAANDKNDDTKPIYSVSFSIFGVQQYMRTTALAIT